MALPELIANSPVPGQNVPITALSSPVTTAPAPGTSETWTYAASPPAALAQAGQFRIVVDQEILLDITGGSGRSRTVLRAQEGTTAQTHATGAEVYHDLTAGGIAGLLEPVVNVSSPAAGSGVDFNGSAWVVDDRPVDLWNAEASPSSVTDWGPIYNALSGAPAFLGPHDFPFSTKLVLPTGAQLKGCGGTASFLVDPTVCRLIWEGTGSTDMLSVADGVVCEDFALLYSSGSNTGSFLDCSGVGGIQFARLYLGSVGRAYTSAQALAKTVNSYGVTFRDCIMGCADSGIRGQETGEPESSSVEILGGVMYGCPNGFFVNIGQAWRMEGNRLEISKVGGSWSKVINNDIGALNGSFILSDWMVEDAGAGAPTLITQVASEVWDCLITGGVIISSNHPGPLAVFGGNGTIRVVDNPQLSVGSTYVMDLGDGTSGASLKRLIRVTGNYWQTAQSAGNPDILNVQSQVLNGADVLIENNGDPIDTAQENTPVTRQPTAKEAVNKVTASGAAQTLPDPTVATIHDITLTADCTFTFPTITYAQYGLGQSFLVGLKQGGSGSYTATWPGSVDWGTAGAPTLSTAVGKRDLLSFVTLDGTNWLGFLAGPGFSH